MKDIHVSTTPPLPGLTLAEGVNEGFDSLQKNIAGYLPKDVSAGGTVPLPAEESYNGILVFTGTLPSNTTVEVPAAAMQWTVINNTTGAYSLTLKTAAGASIRLPRNIAVSALCDGTDVILDSFIKQDVVDANTINLYLSDGTTDVLIGTLNPTTHTWTIAGEQHGNYTPGTPTTTVNIDSVTLNPVTYTRKGNRVRGFGQFSIDTTATGGFSFEIDPPVASAFTATYQAAGVGSNNGTPEVLRIAANAATDKLQFSGNASSTASRVFSFMFDMEIL